jgi:hypothetical protein
MIRRLAGAAAVSTATGAACSPATHRPHQDEQHHDLPATVHDVVERRLAQLVEHPSPARPHRTHDSTPCQPNGDRCHPAAVLPTGAGPAAGPSRASH